MAFILSSFGCTGDASESVTALRDSAGISIVESLAPAWGAGQSWVLGDEPTRRIGGSPGESESVLWQVTGVLHLSDGRIVVANGGSKEIRYYGPDGSLLHATGQEGEGPGEFRSLSRIWSLPGDSVLAYDARLDRISLYDGFGSFAGVFQAPRVGVSYRHAFPDGVMLGTGTRGYRTGERSQVHRDSVPYTLHRRDGDVLDTIGWYQGDEDYVISTPQLVGILNPPFRRQAALAVHDGELYTGFGDRYEIRVWSRTGQLRRILRRIVPPVDAGSAINEFKAGFDDPEMPPGVRAGIDDFTFPPTMPAFTEFLVDTEGDLWVRRPAWPRTQADGWDVFDPGGVFLGTVGMPEGFELQQIGRDWALGVWTDEMDVEYVDLYLVKKPTR